jgi:Fur family ferric uptake transcriptional regulator
MKELEILREYIKGNNIRQSVPREQVIRMFLKTEKHVSIQELHGLVVKSFPKIGLATVYRSMKIACGAGLAREIELSDSTMRYEHLFGHEHHDHLICIECGKFEEVKSQKIEKEQEKIAEEFGYMLVKHRHMLYGICPACKKK